MADSLKVALSRLEAGDIIHGCGNWGPSLILLVLSQSGDVITCRRITSGETLKFSSVNGQMIGEPETWIDSIYPLPREFHDAFIDLDRTYRCVDPDLYPKGIHVTAVQKKALLFIKEFYRTHPIGGPRSDGNGGAESSP